MPKKIKREPLVMAILQNMWFKDPERMKIIYEKYISREEDGRQTFIRDFLFFGCLTGKRLDNAFEPIFGDEWRWRIVWEESSHQWGNHSASSFGYDVDHICSSLKKYKPGIVMTFGNIARDGWRESNIKYLDEGNEKVVEHIIAGPHPAARGASVTSDLRAMAVKLRVLLQK